MDYAKLGTINPVVFDDRQHLAGLVWDTNYATALRLRFFEINLPQYLKSGFAGSPGNSNVKLKVGQPFLHSTFSTLRTFFHPAFSTLRISFYTPRIPLNHYIIGMNTHVFYFLSFPARTARSISCSLIQRSKSHSREI